LPRLLNVVYVRLRRAVAGSGSNERDTQERLRAFDELMTWPVSEQERRDTWGQTADAVAEQNAMFSMLGGASSPS
jgi:hypothetical protein